MANSAFNVSDWFGVLFINVLGNWNGSFGVDTSRGNEIATSAPPTTEQPTAASAPAQVFSFIARSVSSGGGSSGATGTSTEATTEPNSAAVLAASDFSSSSPTLAASDTSGPVMISIPVAVAAIAGLAIGVALIIRLIGLVRTRLA